MLTIIKFILVGSKILWIIRLRLTIGEGDVVVIVVFAEVDVSDNLLSILIKNKSEITDTTEKLMSGTRSEGLLIFSIYDIARTKKVIVTATVADPLISTKLVNLLLSVLLIICTCSALFLSYSNCS